MIPDPESDIDSDEELSDKKLSDEELSDKELSDEELSDEELSDEETSFRLAKNKFVFALAPKRL